MTFFSRAVEIAINPESINELKYFSYYPISKSSRLFRNDAEKRCFRFISKVLSQIIVFQQLGKYERSNYSKKESAANLH